MMEKIRNWVYDSTSEKKLNLTIKSMSLRKCLDKAIKGEFNYTGVFFVWDRKFTETYVEKTKKFQQKNFLRGFAKKNVTSDLDLVASLGFFDTKSVSKKSKKAEAAQNDDEETKQPVRKQVPIFETRTCE